MFVTGPAGAGKSTTIEVAQQFVLNFAVRPILSGVKKHFFSLQLLVVQRHCSVEFFAQCGILKVKVKN